MISALVELKLLSPAVLPGEVLTTAGVLEVVTTGGVGKPDRPPAPPAVGVAAPLTVAEIVPVLEEPVAVPAADAPIGTSGPPGTANAVPSTTASHRRVPLTPTPRRHYRSDASGCSIAGVFGGLR